MCCVCAACELRGVLALLEMIKGGVERERERGIERVLYIPHLHTWLLSWHTPLLQSSSLEHVIEVTYSCAFVVFKQKCRKQRRRST